MTPFLTTTGGGSVRGFGRQGIQRLSSGPPAYVSGASLLLDAGQASSYSSGTAWVDLSGNGYDMTWQSSYGRGGSGTAAYFTQGSAYAQRTSTSFYGASQTWSGWFYPTVVPTVVAGLLEEDDGTGINQILLQLANDGANVKVGWNGYDTAAYRFQTPMTGGAAGLPINVWYHICGTYDGSNAYLYVNGVQVSTVAQTGAITAVTTTFKIGAYTVGNVYPFTGRTAQVILYSSALTAAQVQTNFNAVCTRYGYSPI